MEAGRSARQVARELDRSDCVVRGVLGPVDPTDIIYTKTRRRTPTTEQPSKRPAHEYKMHEYSSCFIGMSSWHSGAVHNETGLQRNGARLSLAMNLDLISAVMTIHVRVWRPIGERLNPVFALQRHTPPTAGVMVWGFMANNAR
ncbi:uncharacterized protein TNCV_1791521 [Trichonephila clavipes]|nr:uncharacterized protein TNCV_1791521 [Trichonephila clavipes]